MKTKIILIFFLLTISLFGQFKEEKNGFTIKTTSHKKMDCTIKAVNGSFIVSKEPPTSFSSGNLFLIFEGGYLSSSSIDGEATIYNTKQLLVSKEKGLYRIALLDKLFVKKLLQAMVVGDIMSIQADGELHFFRLDQYMSNIIESDFYKEVMK